MRCYLNAVRLIAAWAATWAIGITTVAHAYPEPAACYTIKQGETAASIALRLTGNAQHRHEPWFQIVDAAHSRVLRKSRYRRLQPGWVACVPSSRLSVEWVRGRPTTTVNAAASDVHPETVPTGVPAIVWWGMAAAVVLWVTYAVRYYMTRRRAIITMMQRFGERFVLEFERPLIQPGREPPVESRLRVVPRRRRLEILLAPTGGRRYPNLSDHRKNVEYDAERVVRLLKDDRFTGGQLGTHGRWVVIACHFRVDSEQKGSK
jgi:hypothetical protein